MSTHDPDFPVNRLPFFFFFSFLHAIDYQQIKTTDALYLVVTIALVERRAIVWEPLVSFVGDRNLIA